MTTWHARGTHARIATSYQLQPTPAAAASSPCLPAYDHIIVYLFAAAVSSPVVITNLYAALVPRIVRVLSWEPAAHYLQTIPCGRLPRSTDLTVAYTRASTHTHTEPHGHARSYALRCNKKKRNLALGGRFRKIVKNGTQREGKLPYILFVGVLKSDVIRTSSLNDVRSNI